MCALKIEKHLGQKVDPAIVLQAEVAQQQDRLIDTVQAAAAAARDNAHKPAPLSPPRRKMIAALLQQSPRTAAAHQLAQVNLGASGPVPSIKDRLKRAFSQGDETTPAARPSSVISTRLRPRNPRQQSLAVLLDAYQLHFWQFLKTHSTMPDVRESELMTITPLLALREVFFSVESQEFLDHYITRDSAVGKNKHPEMQVQFEKFHEKLMTLKSELEKVGISGVKAGETINFWSGREGKARAAADTGLSDSDVPLFQFLFDCSSHIRKHEPLKPGGPAAELIVMLPTLFSAMFATYAEGSVNVYMFSKNGGDKSVINVDSAFWSAELYALANNSQVSHVNLFLHQGKDAQGHDQWAPAIDLKSTDPAEIKHRDAVVYLSARGKKDLKVSMGALKECISRWSRAAKAAQLRGVVESEC